MDDDADKASALKSFIEPLAGANDELEPDTSASLLRLRRGRLVGSYAATNHFRSAKWSADGTSIITNSDDHVLRTLVV